MFFFPRRWFQSPPPWPDLFVPTSPPPDAIIASATPERLEYMLLAFLLWKKHYCSNNNQQFLVWTTNMLGFLFEHVFLVGGWTNPSEKYDRQIGAFSQVRVKIRNIWNHHPVLLVIQSVSFTLLPSRTSEKPSIVIHHIILCLLCV